MATLYKHAAESAEMLTTISIWQHVAYRLRKGFRASDRQYGSYRFLGGNLAQLRLPDIVQKPQKPYGYQ